MLNLVIRGLLLTLWLFICLEGAARLFFSSDRLCRHLSSVDDSSWRLAWIRQHRLHEGDLYPFASGQCAEYHPTRGWMLKPNIKALSLPDGTFLNTNSAGLRGSKEYPYFRIGKKDRIVVLGDSFTFGEEVADEQTYVHILESTLPNAEVLNLGVPGYGQDQMLLYLQEEGVKYHPDVVVLGFVSGDMGRNLLSFYAYAKPKFRFDHGHVELTNTPVPTPDRILADEPYRLKSFDLMHVSWDVLRWRVGAIGAKARNSTSPLLDEILGTTRRIGATPVFVYLPVLGEIADPSESMSVNERYLQGYCEERRCPCLFLRPRFREETKKGAKLKTQGHWDAEEHALAAREIADFLLRRHLIQEENGT